MTTTVSSSATIVRPPTRSAVRLIAAGSAAAAGFGTGGILELTNLHWHGVLAQTPAQRIAMIGFVVGLLASAPLLAALGRLCGRVGRSAARASIGAQLAIAAMTIDSVVQGHDAAFFNPVAAVANAVWLPAFIAIAVSLWRRGTFSRPLSVGLVGAYFATIPLAQAGGGLLAAGYWLAVSVWLYRAAATEPVAQRAAQRGL